MNSSTKTIIGSLFSGLALSQVVKKNPEGSANQSYSDLVDELITAYLPTLFGVVQGLDEYRLIAYSVWVHEEDEGVAVPYPCFMITKKYDKKRKKRIKGIRQIPKGDVKDFLRTGKVLSKYKKLETHGIARYKKPFLKFKSSTNSLNPFAGQGILTTRLSNKFDQPYYSLAVYSDTAFQTGALWSYGNSKWNMYNPNTPGLRDSYFPYLPAVLSHDIYSWSIGEIKSTWIRLKALKGGWAGFWTREQQSISYQFPDMLLEVFSQEPYLPSLFISESGDEGMSHQGGPSEIPLGFIEKIRKLLKWALNKSQFTHRVLYQYPTQWKSHVSGGHFQFYDQDGSLKSSLPADHSTAVMKLSVLDPDETGDWNNWTHRDLSVSFDVSPALRTYLETDKYPKGTSKYSYVVCPLKANFKTTTQEPVVFLDFYLKAQADLELRKELDHPKGFKELHTETMDYVDQADVSAWETPEDYVLQQSNTVSFPSLQHEVFDRLWDDPNAHNRILVVFPREFLFQEHTNG